MSAFYHSANSAGKIIEITDLLNRSTEMIDCSTTPRSRRSGRPAKTLQIRSSSGYFGKKIICFHAYNN